MKVNRFSVGISTFFDFFYLKGEQLCGPLKNASFYILDTEPPNHALCIVHATEVCTKRV